jgi:predicted Ser/Thr protein kinase
LQIDYHRKNQEDWALRTFIHYEVLEKLGEGGMGVVWKARDTRLDRFVALKVLPADKVSDPERRRRFEQEAKAASALNHPNAAHIYEIGEKNGAHFLAMEYVEGETLEARLGGEKPGQTLDATALVHEAWLRLADASIEWKDCSHFFRTAATAMRRILVDRARAKLCDKRGGGAFKCTMCQDRLGAGLQPACATACPTESIMFGPLDETRPVSTRAGSR